MKRIKSYLMLLVIALFIGACSAGTETQSEAVEATDDTRPLGQASVVDDESAPNILQVAIGSADHTTLVAAVQAAKIEHVLVNAGPLTVFAPTNDAFAKLPEGTVENLVLPENIETLKHILNGHAAPGSYNLEGLKKENRKGRKIYMANGTYLDVTIEGEDVFVGGAKVLGTVQTSNGIINVVDSVILPE